MNPQKVILLLGRRDEPVDGVVDYCEKLCKAGVSHGMSFELVPTHWAEKGWRGAFAELRKAAADWRNKWVLLQFTTLAWSRRGFPLRAPRVLDIVKESGARPAVIFHDFMPLHGLGIIGSIREYSHLRVLRQLYERSDLAIFTVPLDKISWLCSDRKKAVFIPVGANCSEANLAIRDDPSNVKTVVVYSITGGDQTSTEVADVAIALKRACKSVGQIRLLLFGRGSREAESALRLELAGADVEIESLGLISPVEVRNSLSRSDVQLFVRGHISTRRGSAIAAIACGLPIVCYSGPETTWPITEAGILAVPYGKRDALAKALEIVLRDDRLRRTLAERSRDAYEKYFSWAAITEQFAEALSTIPTKNEIDLTKKLDNAIQNK